MTDHIPFVTFTHPDAQTDFEHIAPTRKEVKKNLAQQKDERRCTRCGVIASEAEGLKVCGKCKFSRYCSRECQVADWSDHKKTCKVPRDTDDEGERKHPDLAIKLAQHVPSNDYLLHLLQLYSILCMDLLENPSNATSNMLQITVSCLPSDTMGYLRAMMNGQDNSKMQVMLNFDALKSVPLSLTPAMQLELDEKKLKAKPDDIIVALMFTNGTKNFFHPVTLLSPALQDGRNKPPISIKSSLSDITELPLNESNLRDTMNSFVRMDKKNQMKLRAMPK
ncbi:hypothetical protein Hypma_001716 [Hypsizygus marmoreus]|uniref:MYND-type domain-containing protein n=1 Tax=Hypsizygus marmoreus TaxID=39966 RepID=A0A369JBH9_HYPMA|nr:hypothetical protein Hypma_001716 [Hypsizygus marmoreus]